MGPDDVLIALPTSPRTWNRAAMNRKWRTNPGALYSVASYPAFRESIPPSDGPYTLASPTDLYAVYTVLHIESKQAELRWSPHGRFYYFHVQWQHTLRQGERAVAAPEGDEDMPEIVPEGSEAAQQPQQKQQQQQQKRQKGGDGAPAAAPGSSATEPGGQQQQQAQEQPQPQQQEQQPQQQQEQAQQQEQQAQQEQQPPPQPEQPAAPAPRPSRLRTQIVVPVSSACDHLTPELLQRFFAVRGVQAQQLLLALVDSNGVVTRSCLYNYIQAPLEGPGTANLELLDD